MIETQCIPALMSSNSGEVTQRWALDGAGIVLKSAWDIEEELETESLVKALGNFSADRADIFIVFPVRDYLPSRVRTFIDFISERFAEYGGRLDVRS